jgi:type I restriction enzyme S subunit
MDSTILQPEAPYPAEWRRMSFEDFTVLKRGKDLTREQFREGKVPVAGSNGVIGYHDTANVSAPGVTVGRSGSVGKVNFYEEDFWAHNTALFVSDFHGNYPPFVGYFLEHLRLGRFGSGASVPTLDRNIFRALPVVVPIPGEQRKIASVLGLVQRAIEQQERLIALTTELKKSLMHKLFSEGLRGERQKQTEIGPVPESWEFVPIGSLGKVVTGTTPKTKVPEYYSPSEVDFITPADLGKTRQIYNSEKKISQRGLMVSRSLPKDAVLCVCIGSSIGKVGMTSKDDCATNQQINSIICNEKHVPAFLYYLLAQFSNYWRGFATFGPVPILSKGGFEAINIVVPPTRQEENVIAECLSSIDAKTEAHMRKKGLLSDLFCTLLHQLMIAQIRVHDLDLSGLGLDCDTPMH